MMQKRILILLSIMGTLISACNGGNSSSSAVPKTPKSIAGDPTPAPSPSTSPYFPNTSQSYKSLAVMRVHNDNTMYPQYDYVEVGANGTAFLGQAYVNQGTKTQVTNWRRLNFQGALGDFTQVIGCNSDENGTTFIAVGNNGEAYILNDNSGNITSSKVAGISNNVSLVGATCINSTDQNGQEEKSVIFAGNRLSSSGPGTGYIMIYKGELISTGGSGYQVFNIVPSGVLLPNNPASGKVYAIASDNKQNIALAGDSGDVLLSSNAGQSWQAYTTGRNDIIRSIAFNPVTSDFVYGGSLSYGVLNTTSGFTQINPLSMIINGASYDDDYGINSVVCGVYNCLLSGVDEVPNTGLGNDYMIILNSEGYQLLGVKNPKFGGQNQTMATSQITLVDDDGGLATYYALNDNQIYSQDIDDSSVTFLWNKVATLPTISQ